MKNSLKQLRNSNLGSYLTMFESWYTIKELINLLSQNNGYGIYTIKCISHDAFSDQNLDFHLEYKEREFSEIIYIGKACGRGKLLKRLKSELFQKGKGTFFRSIGAVLKYDPMKTQVDPANYKFRDAERDKIIDFMNGNFVVSYMILDLPESEIAKKEVELIVQYKPIFNIDHNPHKSKILNKERTRCRNIARGII